MNITIRDMFEDEFDKSINMGQPYYIEGKSKALNITYEQAKVKSLKEYAAILPDGFNTDGHKFYTALVDDEFAGFAWVQIIENDSKISAWGYDIHVEDSFRRKGIAKNIFSELKLRLKTLGVSEVKFHVYADNFRAIPLYEHFGFETTNIIMRKNI